MQRSAGNAAAARLVEEQRATAGAADGHAERTEHAGHAEHAGQECAVQRSAADEVGSVVRSAGSRLAPSLQREMETRFGGEDFSDVTVHTGAAARRSADAVGAEAYTTATNHIVFRAGIAKKTLAHELEHVRQQRGGQVAGTETGGGLRVSNPADRFEKSAERTADEVMRGGAPTHHQAATHDTASTANAAGGASGAETAQRSARPAAAASVQRMPKQKKGKKAAQDADTAAPSQAPAKSEFEQI
ncbi:DUF4157 domain-containing protein, partial [Streptomyces sp. NPDC048611]|uniref:eCIS core domain-containing protein n=1 Tax=Streptomyces sp. NPDC048611 TaxID=3155635 RepID=UPI003448658A